MLVLIYSNSFSFFHVKLARCLDRLSAFAEKYKSIPTLGYTHFQWVLSWIRVKSILVTSLVFLGPANSIESYQLNSPECIVLFSFFKVPLLGKMLTVVSVLIEQSSILLFIKHSTSGTKGLKYIHCTNICPWKKDCKLQKRNPHLVCKFMMQAETAILPLYSYM